MHYRIRKKFKKKIDYIYNILIYISTRITKINVINKTSSVELKMSLLYTKDKDVFIYIQ